MKRRNTIHPSARSGRARRVLTAVSLCLLGTMLPVPPDLNVPTASAAVSDWPSTGWVNPRDGRNYNNYEFGVCGDPPYLPGKAHLGADSQGEANYGGAPVVAMAAGTVTAIGTWTGWGGYIAVAHQSTSGGFVAVYGHVNVAGGLARVQQ